MHSGAAAQILTPDAAARVASLLAQSPGVAPTRAALGQLPVEQLGRAASAIADQIETPPDPATWRGLAFGQLVDDPHGAERQVGARKGWLANVASLKAWTSRAMRLVKWRSATC
jgi:hypothetical protein